MQNNCNRNSLWQALGTLVSLLLFTPFVAASEKSVDQTMQRSTQLYEHGQYTESIKLLEQLLESYRLRKMEDIVQAHTTLGASYFNLGDEKRAKLHFQSLLNFSPGIQLDPLYYSPRMRQFLQNLKQQPSPTQEKPVEVVANGSAQNAIAPAFAQNSLSTPLPTLPKSLIEESEPAHDPRALRFIPFGYGQFRNDDRAKGFLFLITEGLALGTALTSLTLYHASNDSFHEIDSAKGHRNTFLISFFSFTAIAIVGVVDALLGYPHRERKTIDPLATGEHL